MADPRIKYDVIANTEGEADVKRLAIELDKLDEAIDPQLANRAKQLSAELLDLGNRRAAISGLLEAMADSSQAATRLQQASEAVDTLGKRLEQLENPTRKQAAQLEKLRKEAADAQAAFTRKTAALNTARVAVERYGINAQDLGTKLDIVEDKIRATRKAAADVASAYQQAATAATASGAAQARAGTQAQSAVESLTGTYRRLQGIAAVAIGGGIFTGLIRDVSQTADEFKNLQARIRLVTGEGAAFDEAFRGVEEIANRTNTRLETTGTLFARIATAGKDLGLAQRDALQLTETINQAIQVSGGSAQAADAAITQLIQGLQSGVLRGEEFNSVVEQSPRLAQALADGLGVARGELRKLANEGQLTSDVVIKALQSQADTVATEFSKLPPTVGRALTTLSNNWTLYVGEVDKANGISEKAAQLILLLAENLDTLGNALIVAGKAVAAYKALQLAQSLLGTAAAARAAAAAKGLDTVATQANTVATQANTVAKTANVAASAAATAAAAASARTAAAASTGILAKGAALLRFAGFAGLVVSAIVAIGSAIGDVFGSKAKKIDDANDSLKDNAAAADASAQSHDALAESVGTATEATEKLSTGAKRIVDDFGSIQRKSSQAGEAVAKLAQSLDLGNIEGITDAVNALEDLERRGKITGDEIRKAIGGALKDLDLGTFKTQALAAFDGTERGARRLQTALDAIADESLRRVGTSLDELRSGFSATATKAINDLDELEQTLETVGADAETTGRLLGQGLNKAAAAADTEKAIKAVIDRLEVLGKQGKISGEQLTEGLEAARKKLDEIKPGVDSLAEAYRTFGLKTKAELQAVADRNREAWLQIRNDATASLATKQQAFRQYAESSIAANGGVADSNLKVEAAIQKVEIQVDKAGKATVKSMGEAGEAVDKTRKRFNELNQEINEYGNVINQLAGNIGGSVDRVRSAANGTADNLLAPGIKSDFGPDAYGPDGTRAGGGFQVDVPAGYYYTLDAYAPGVERPAGYTRDGVPIPGFFARLPGSGGGGGSNVGTFGGFAGSPAQRAGQPNPNVVTKTVQLDLKVNGGAPIPVTTTESNADRLLRELELAQGTGG